MAILEGRKTYIAILAGLLVVVGGFLQGQFDLGEALNQAVLLLGIGGLRAAK